MTSRWPFVRYQDGKAQSGQMRLADVCTQVGSLRLLGRDVIVWVCPSVLIAMLTDTAVIA